jgi:excisionase family DNA binding protein
MATDMLEASQGRLLGVNATASYLNVTEQTIRRLMARGVLTPVRLPAVRRILFDRQDLDRLIESGKTGDKTVDETMPLAAVGVADHG